MKRLSAVFLAGFLLFLCACGTKEAGLSGPPEVPGLTFRSAMETDYAEGFAVYTYDKDYQVVSMQSGRSYLLVPEGEETPSDLPDGMQAIQLPVGHIYLAATSAMALFDELDALDMISYSGTDADGWYIEAARAAMEDGAISYAGKYSRPDYEELLSGGCELAVESQMILHTPEVEEKLKELQIPVWIDESSTESHPLGRTEWIRAYGALLGREAEADRFFEAQKALIEGMGENTPTEKTVAFFFLNSAGLPVVRRSGDYIPRMIALAGGTYLPEHLSGDADSRSGSVTLSMEEFYAAAKDADFLVYNATIDAPLSSVSELLQKDSLFSEFRAVKEGKVYTTEKSLYQQTDLLAAMIVDFRSMLTGSDSELTFLRRVDD